MNRNPAAVRAVTGRRIRVVFSRSGQGSPRRVPLALALGLLAAALVRADGTAQTPPFSQDWSNTGLITTDDNWAGVPGVIGYRGDNLTAATGVDPQTVLADGTEVPDVNANRSDPDTFATGGVAEFDGIANPAIALNGSGTADAPFILLDLNTTGFAGVTVSYNLRDLDGSGDNAIQQVALQFRLGSTGNFTNVPAGYVADATTGPNLATQVTPKSVILPETADNQALVQVRIITTNAVGNDEWVGIDDIVVTGTPTGGSTPPTGVGSANPAVVNAGDTTLLTVTVTPGTNPTSTGLAVTADLSAIGGSGAQPFLDDGTNGDVTAGDNVFSFEATVAGGTTPGIKALPATITDAEARSGSALLTLQVRSDVVISQIYGGGGNSGATLKNDFIELFNRGTSPINVTGWSVQYSSAAGTSWQVTPLLSGSIPPGGYYLIQQGAGGGGTVDLPTPDVTGSIAMSATAGKVALVGDATPSTGSGCPFAASVFDFVGYGSTATCSETSPTTAPSNTTAVLRAFNGCIDTGNNSADFDEGTPDPRNSASPARSCVPLGLAIHEIQGAGTASPHVGELVGTSGIVTGHKLNGFFIQTPGAGDGDAGTSEGIFVFTSSAPPPAAAVGNSVRVVGLVEEFVPSQDADSPPTTEISGPPVVSLLSTGNDLPDPITLTAADTDPAGSIEQLERFEGMRVHVASLTAVSPTQGSVDEPNATSTTNGVFYGVITGVARPFREPGIQVPDPLPPDSPCCVPRFDGNPERLRVDSDGQPGAVPLELTTGALVTGLTGPFDYAFRTYTILPDPPPASPPSVSGNISAVPVRAPAADEFTVASFNLERFFDTVNDPSIGEPVLTAAALDNRLTKASLAIRSVLRAPDVIGVQEAENLSTLQTLAARVNSDAVAAGQPDPNYQADLVEGNDVGGIDVGLLVKGPPRVNVIAVTQEGKDATFINPETSLPETLNDRPPLVLRATIQPPSGSPAPVTVIVNHLRSLSGIDDPVDGNRVRTKRRAQAEFLADLIQARQLADPHEKTVSVGDYNAFPFSDGYVDSIGTIKGTPTPTDQVVLASEDLVHPDLVDLVDLLPPPQRYSFSFDGNAQVLDHVIVTQNLLPAFRGLQYARNDADFPESFRNDPTRPERLSDHDMPVAYFSAISIGATSPARLWLGLKSHAGRRTRFDVRAALYVNGTLVAEGETRCVAGLTRDPADAKEVSIPFGPISDGELVSGDVLSLEVLTRIGTNPDGSRCAGHRSAVGLRLYHDSVSRPSRFGAEITPDPLRDYFLHSSESTLFLDTTAPTAARPRHKDSGPVKFRGGNPWVKIGTWNRQQP